MARREYVRDIELAVQKTWEETGHGEAEPDQTKEKYFITFPYPYMNGRLHLGHGYSLTKPEINARFKKLQGYNVLWPFGLHCTGMPIMAAADKLRKERDCPEEEGAESKQADGAKVHAKIAAKTGGVKKQSDILRAMNIPEEEIMSFTDPNKWLDYFPAYCIQDLKKMGFSGDLRRSFITTVRNPYYDAFIRWQFTTLKERGYIGYGLRPTVFSAVDNQPCLDHDRSVGEGAAPQEFTGVKVKVLSPNPEWEAQYPGKTFYFVCATLRPETMYGQTSVFALPHGDYAMTYLLPEKMNPQGKDLCARIGMNAEESAKACDSIIIGSDRCFRNMMHQGIVPVCPETGSYHKLGSLKGFDLLGKALKAPLTPIDTIYCLPMNSILMDKGTGIVTSVPSDSPDDYIMVRELKNNMELRSKYKMITDEMVEIANTIIEIVETPGLGNAAAVTVADRLKIKGPDDVKKLAEAKAECYTKGFYEGKLLVGPHKGTIIEHCKLPIRKILEAAGDAFIYHEPDAKVTSRSGDDCVVAQLNQWYLKYGDEEWKKPVRSWITEGLNCFNEQVKHQFLFVVDWLDSWACTRNYGLGTSCPWEPDQLIESLSDSTIYYAYYTIKHHLHSDLHGDKMGDMNIKAEDMTHQVWDYIMDQTDVLPESPIPAEQLMKLREEFCYWYPMNFRSSAKDLVPNHLTMSLFHHEAIWPGKAETRQNQEYFVNGHVLVDSQKMSKSLGNFMTVDECIDMYGADGMRIACATAGDTMADANFERPVAENAMLKLYTLYHHIEKYQLPENSRTADEPMQPVDQLFLALVSKNATDGHHYFDKMKYREAMRAVYFEMVNIEGRYLSNCMAMGIKPHAGVHQQWFSALAICLSPVAPHFCEHIWTNILKKEGSVGDQAWPVIDVEDLEIRKAEYFYGVIDDLRKTADKSKTKPEDRKATLYVAKDFLPWQKTVLSVLEEVCEFDNTGRLSNKDDAIAAMRKSPTLKTLGKKEQGIALGFGVYHMNEDVSRSGKEALSDTIAIDEKAMLEAFSLIVSDAIGVADPANVSILVGAETDAEGDKSKGKIRSACRPYKPTMFI